MKKINNLFFALLIYNLSFAQVPKKVVVEHFTNTKCSVCASRNPGFYTNYFAQSGVIHLAIHPSSPYSGCLFSMHNPSENDARTNYYGIYGGTPRLVVQGVVVPSSSNYASSSIFTPYLGQTSPASIKIYQSKFGTDSIGVTIVIKTEATHTLSNLTLFIALAEDVVNYTGSNGEPKHYDVFRKSLSGVSGLSVVLPNNIGDSVIVKKSSLSNSAWNFSKIFTLAILQESNKAVVQSESVPANLNNNITNYSHSDMIGKKINVFVYDKNLNLKQEVISEAETIGIYDITGKLQLIKKSDNLVENIPLNSLAEGIYFYVVKSKEIILKTGKLIIH